MGVGEGEMRLANCDFKDTLLYLLVESSVLQLDETEEKVRAIPEKRCVLILREIPKDTPKEVQ